MPLIKNVLKPLVKSSSIPLGSTVAAAAAAAAAGTDALFKRKCFWPGMTIVIISNEKK